VRRAGSRRAKIVADTSKFATLLTRLARVQKAEIDEQERNEARKFKARKTHKAYAKPGQIASARPQK
jgi:hypothetical protein